MTIEQQDHPVKPPYHRGLRRLAGKLMSIAVALNNYFENSSNFPVVGPEYKDPEKSRRRQTYKPL